MARVNVEQKALTDPRFDLLGRFLESTRHDALGRMIFVWNECQERSSYTLPACIVSAIMGNLDGCEWLVQADLGQWVDDNTVRIKGTEGRIEWLGIKRATAQTNGKKGGRPITKHQPTNNLQTTDIGSPSVPVGNLYVTPPAPAPAPAPALNAGEAAMPSHGTNTAETVKELTSLWLFHKAGKKPYQAEILSSFKALVAAGFTVKELREESLRPDRMKAESWGEFQFRLTKAKEKNNGKPSGAVGHVSRSRAEPGKYANIGKRIGGEVPGAPAETSNDAPPVG